MIYASSSGSIETVYHYIELLWWGSRDAVDGIGRREIRVSSLSSHNVLKSPSQLVWSYREIVASREQTQMSLRESPYVLTLWRRDSYWWRSVQTTTFYTPATQRETERQRERETEKERERERERQRERWERQRDRERNNEKERQKEWDRKRAAEREKIQRQREKDKQTDWDIARDTKRQKRGSERKKETES